MSCAKTTRTSSTYRTLRSTRWAKRNRHEVVAILSDIGTSGATTAVEPSGLTEAVTLIKSGAVNGLVVRDLDRLARSVTVQEAVLAVIWTKPERKVYTTTGEVLRDDPDDPYRTAMRQMVAVFTELERRMIAKRLRHGRAAKKARGGRSVGPAPFGYRTKDSELT